MQVGSRFLCSSSYCSFKNRRADIRVFLLGLLLLDLCRIGPLQSRVLDLDCGSSWGCEPSFPCFQRLFRFVNLFSELENPGFENPNLMMPRGGGGGGGVLHLGAAAAHLT